LKNPVFSKIIAVWPTLPEHIKAAIRALIDTVEATRGQIERVPVEEFAISPQRKLKAFHVPQGLQCTQCCSMLLCYLEKQL